MPKSSAAQTEEARVFVEQAGEHGLRDVAADNLVAEGSRIVLRESSEAAVMAEASLRYLGL